LQAITFYISYFWQIYLKLHSHLFAEMAEAGQIRGCPASPKIKTARKALKMQFYIISTWRKSG
jgi:hypothetical protein